MSESEESDDEREDSDVRSFETAQKEKARVFEEDGVSQTLVSLRAKIFMRGPPAVFG